MIKSKKLRKFNNIKHGFFNNKGGISSGIYKSLNCGIGSNDSKKNVIKNLKIVSKKIGIKNKLIDRNTIVESLMSFKRAGASAIVTYFALDIAKKIKSN